MNENKRLFEYFSKSSFYIKIAKFAAIILMLVFSISCIISFRKDINIENIQLLSRFISLDGSSSHYTDEFPVTVKEDSDVIMLRDNVAVISNGNISLHDLSGRKLFSYNYSMSSPAVSCDDHYILVYDIGGSEATVFNSFSKIKTFKFDFPIYSADIKNDHIAVVTGNDLSRTILYVYKFDNKEKDYVLRYSKQFDRFINSVSLAENGKQAFVSTISSLNGKYDCLLSVFDTDSTSSSPILSYPSESELPVKVSISKNGAELYAVTDSSLMFFGKNLQNINTYHYNQNKISGYYSNNSLIVLTERNNLAGNSMKLTVLSSDGTKVRDFTVSDEIYDVSIGKNFVYALGKNSVYRYAVATDNIEQDSTSPIDVKYHSVVCDTQDNCYLVSFTLVSKVTF